MKAIFVGGTRDGELIEVRNDLKHSQEIVMPVKKDPVAIAFDIIKDPPIRDTENYIRIIITVNLNHNWIVYVHDSIKPIDGICRILNYYVTKERL